MRIAMTALGLCIAAGTATAQDAGISLTDCSQKSGIRAVSVCHMENERQLLGLITRLQGELTKRDEELSAAIGSYGKEIDDIKGKATRVDSQISDLDRTVVRYQDEVFIDDRDGGAHLLRRVKPLP